MDLFNQLASSLAGHGEQGALLMDGIVHTYADLARYVSDQKAWIRGHLPEEEKVVAVLANDDPRTYASILALWSEGKAYLPIAPDAPADRNEAILRKAGVSTLLSSSDHPSAGATATVRTDVLPGTALDASFRSVADDALAYLLFTSGTTGEPKGVPITRGNVAAFIEAFQAMGIPVSRGDRCLQMFDLTFDLSVMSYLVPLMHGACVCTVPKGVVKYGYIAELLEEAHISLALMVPSIINYLRPYFDEIHLPQLRYALFCGEALPADITAEWSRCVPNASIINVYGPTEHTIFCTEYHYQRDDGNKEHNGILSIGKAMSGSALIVVDEEQRSVPAGAKGELCLAGPQLTPGYWNDPERTAQVMFTADHRGAPTRFYRTGDLCSMDTNGDILYMGRLDHQIKVQGYRVELGEIEHHARHYLGKSNVVALAVKNELGNTEIALVIEGNEPDTRQLLDHLRSKLPAYMVPTRLRQVPGFPLNTNGKTDRNALARSLTFAAP
jgi:D-alanine--poly(phosphoribitol) ligase subunit 1